MVDSNGSAAVAGHVDLGPDLGNFPGEIRDDFARVPQGTIKWRITNIGEELFETKNGEKKIIKAELVATGPASALGQTYTKIFWVGTKDDPEAKKLETWTFSAVRNFKVMAAKAGVVMEGKNRQLIYSELRDREVVGKVTYTLRQDGNAMADIQEWFEVGAVELHTEPAPARQQQLQGAIPGPARPVGAPSTPPPAIPTKLGR